MKILALTDFSKNSKVAARYAYELAKRLKAEVTLLHVVFIGGPAKGSVVSKARQIEASMIEHSKASCNELIKELSSHGTRKPRISSEVITGYPIAAAAIECADKIGAELIVMGTKGATSLEKTMLGSVAAEMIDQSNVPVITVPNHGRFHGLENVVYASDLASLKPEMRSLVSLLKPFGAVFHILHIVAEGSKKKIKKETLLKQVVEATRYKRLSLHVQPCADVVEGIDDFIADTRADLLVMFTHRLSLFERVFGRGLTRRMAFHLSTPLLSLKKGR